MPSSTKDARTARSGAAFREALLHLLESKPFDQITVRDICAASAVHYATFFRHHPGKDALLHDLAADEIGQAVTLAWPAHAQAKDGPDFAMLCRRVGERRALWTILLNGGASAYTRQEWLRHAHALAEKFPPAVDWLPKELATICDVSLVLDTLSWWLAQPVGTVEHLEIASMLRRTRASVLATAHR
ncbi:MAG: TetR/AcrR family transcriptional regulator [Pseudomonas sp.]|uniref:TetR/AcrR family transcriptional regulator n=1 Tax=Pseudomonas sp. TaxID=306 RepID=UPI00121EBDF4|nr:TetR/AcrR family transcriptional regulator [Pseudomonas sp.]RZI76919.1 MAG: TetR/AcrR family transcriptional regulator [Pseudomonas sp.]